MLIHTPAPSSAAAAIVSRGHTSACQCQRSHALGRRVDDAVPGQVGAQDGAQPPGRVGDRRRELAPAGLGDVRVGCDPELVGEPAPGRRDRPQAVGVPDGARVLDTERPAQVAVLGERGGLRLDHGRDLGKRDDLGVGVIERRSRGGALVHRHHRPGRLAAVRLAARAPGLGGRREHVGRQVGEGQRRARARGSRPPGPGSPGTCSGRRARSSPGSPRARRGAGRAPAPRGRHRLVPLAERARRRVGDPRRPALRPGPPGASRRDDDRDACERVRPDVYSGSAFPAFKAPRMSIGMGRMVVELLVPEISSSVWR